MARPCIENHPIPQPETCRLCKLDLESPEYHALWEQSGDRQTNVARCPYTGPDVEEAPGVVKTRDCPSCNGRVRLKLFSCLCPSREPEEVTAQDCRTCPYRPQDRKKARAVILKNHLSPGDVLVMSAALYSLHQTYPNQFVTAVDCACPAIWEHNPDVVSLERARELGAEYLAWDKDGRGNDELYPAINTSNQHARHFMEAYCLSIGKVLGVAIPLITNRPHVYLSARERTWISQVEDTFGYKGKFWLINAGYKTDVTTKAYPWYQEIVDAMQGRIQFVQIGRTEHQHRPLKGVLNLLGKTDDRQLVRLCYHAQGVVCGVTYLMHLAAALEKPSIVLAGGREPRQWNYYPLSHYLSTIGMLDCCKTEGCWRSRVVKLNDHAESDASLCDLPCYTDPPVPKCQAMLDPAEVVGILSRYS